MLLFTILDYQYLSSGKRNYAQGRASSRDLCYGDRRGRATFEMGRATCSLVDTWSKVGKVPKSTCWYLSLLRMESGPARLDSIGEHT